MSGSGHLFLNDLEDHLLANQVNGIPVEYKTDDLVEFIKILILLYADDTINLSDSAENLKKKAIPSPTLDCLIQPYSALHYPSLSYPLLTLSSHLLISTTLPYSPLSSVPLPYPTASLYPPPTSFPTLSSHLLYSPTIPSSPFIPQLTSLPSNLPSPFPSHIFPSLHPLGYPIYATVLFRPYPTLL